MATVFIFYLLFWKWGEKNCFKNTQNSGSSGRELLWKCHFLVIFAKPIFSLPGLSIMKSERNLEIENKRLGKCLPFLRFFFAGTFISQLCWEKMEKGTIKVVTYWTLIHYTTSLVPFTTYNRLIFLSHTWWLYSSNKFSLCGRMRRDE